MTDEIRSWAHRFAVEHPDVVELYLVGSRATGTARDDSDFDVVAIVTGDEGGLSALGTGWLDRETAGPFAGELGRLDLCVLSKREFDAAELAMFTASAVRIPPDDDRTVQTPVQTPEAEKPE